MNMLLGPSNFDSYDSNILDLLEIKVSKFSSRIALSIKERGELRTVSYGELGLSARRLASYFGADGLIPGERVAILGESSPEWVIGFFGAVRAGAVAVPLDPKLAFPELKLILADCSPRILLISPAYLEFAEVLRKQTTSLQKIVVLQCGTGRSYPSIYDLVNLGSNQDTAPLRRDPGQVALIVYTSGTTGRSKGVMITFANVVFQVRSFENLGLNENDRFLSILPLNHLLELTGGLLAVLHTGGSIHYLPSLFPAEVVEALQEQRSTMLIGVPLFFKTLQNHIQKHLLPTAYQEKKTILEVLGGKLRAFISGGAPLGPDVMTFFEKINIPILEGYGLTETSPVIAVNTFRARRAGSVGRPIDGVEVKIASEASDEKYGEILTRGPHVMKGYHGQVKLTSQAIDREGWFHTGDIGYLEDGFLYITGRKKNLIVLGSGKKVCPEEVESLLRQVPGISEVCVVGAVCHIGIQEGHEEVCAVLVPTPEVIAQTGGTQQVEDLLRQRLEESCRNLAPYKRPTRICIYPQALPKSVTQKIKRAEILGWIDNPKAKVS